MKTLTRVVALLMIVALMAGVMAACGTVVDERILGSWKQEDEIDGNVTWTFEKDGKCSLTNNDTGVVDEGTYKLEGENSGKIHIKLNSWNEEKLCTYVATPKVMDIEEMTFSFHGMKQ